MAFVIADRVQETSTSTGTGTIVLAGAVTGYQSFAVVGNTNTTYYTIADQAGANWEVGIGTYYSGNVSLARTTIIASSNANAVVNFTTGIKAVFITYPAEKAVYSDASNITTITNFASANVLITGGTINGVTISNVTYSGLGTMSTQNANAVVITGGTINNVSLSNVTYGGLGTMSTQNANNVNITGGNAVFTTVNATTSTITNFSSSNVNITGGTINGVSLSNVTYGGLGTMSTQNANSVTITGGTLNNVVIGGTTAANGTFTNLSATLIAGNGSPLSNLNASNLTSGTVGVAFGGTGSANLTAGYVVTGNNTSSVVLIAPGTSGNVLTSNGTAWYSNASSGGGGGSTGIGNSSILALNVNITSNATVNAGVNGFSVGPVNTANGVVVTITSGQRWVII